MSKDKSKKDKRTIQQSVEKPLAAQGISKRGKKVIAFGIGMLVLGFYILSLTDPAGQNWASKLSPFLILGAYAVIGIGIMLPDPDPVIAGSPSNPS